MNYRIVAWAPTTLESKPPRLLDQVRAAIRTKHYSRKTEEAYANWTRKFILFHEKRHPIEMGEAEVGQFLQHLALAGKFRPVRAACARSQIRFLAFVDELIAR